MSYEIQSTRPAHRPGYSSGPYKEINRQHKLQLDTHYLSADFIIYDYVAHLYVTYKSLCLCALQIHGIPYFILVIKCHISIKCQKIRYQSIYSIGFETLRICDLFL